MYHAAGGDSEFHRSYLEAGADIIETNTFGATSVALTDFALQDRVREINLAAAALARARPTNIQLAILSGRACRRQHRADE